VSIDHYFQVDTIHSINAVADVIQTTNSVVDLTRILGVSSFSIEKTLEASPNPQSPIPNPQSSCRTLHAKPSIITPT
jgi:hypothetical protein